MFFRHLPDVLCCPWIFHSSHLWLEHEVVGDLEADTCSSSHFPGYREWRVPGKEERRLRYYRLCQSRGRREEGGDCPADVRFSNEQGPPQPVQTPLQAMSQVQTTPFKGRGESAWASAPSSSVLVQIQNACNGGRAARETVLSGGVCRGCSQQPGSPTGRAVGMLQDLSSSF